MTSNGFFFQNIPTTLVTTAVESLVTTATMTRTASLPAPDQERRQTRVSGPTTRTVTRVSPVARRTQSGVQSAC